MNSYEDRLRLIAQMLDAKTVSSSAMTQYHAILQDWDFRDSPSIREVHYLLAIEPGAGKSISQLAEFLCVTQGAVSQTVARLESKGYVTRVRNPENYRQILAVLTELGEKHYYRHLEQDRDVHANMDRQYLSEYTEEQLREFRDYELKMADIFSSINEKLRRMKAEGRSIIRKTSE